MNAVLESGQWVEPALAAGLVLLGVLAIAWLRLRRHLRTLSARLDEMMGLIHALQNVLRNVYDDGRQARERDEDLEARVALLSRQQEQLMLRDSDTGPYFQAIRHAERGCNADELIRLTGITPAEAELIVALHGKSP